MFEEIVPLEPIHFFALQLDALYAKDSKLEKKHKLPDLAFMSGTLPFAEVALGWHEKGVYLDMSIQGRFDTPDYPQLIRGDVVELFFDTRDMKQASHVTPFCHHFFFLPIAVEFNDEYVQAGEITHFRKKEESHPLCDPKLLKIETTPGKKKCDLKIFIPSECLHGYDPVQFDRLGFTYRIYRVDGSKQYFSASDADVVIENQPSLWASLKLI